MKPDFMFRTFALSAFLSFAFSLSVGASAQTLDQALIAAADEDLKPARAANIPVEYYWQDGEKAIPIRAIALPGSQASVTVNNREVARFRVPLQGQTPIMRAKRMAAGLYAHLSARGDVRVIAPGLSGQAVVIRAGTHELAVLDEHSAELAKQPDARQLALAWTNQTRLALGAPALTRGLPTVSRGLITRDEMRTPVKPSVEESAAMRKFESAAGKALGSGMASWYGPGFHGRRCSDGTRFDMNKMTAAHRTLPFGTMVRVTNKRTGKSVVVRISDRGPFIAGRIVDVSRGAAVALGMLGSGVAPVSIESVGKLPESFWRKRAQLSKTVTAKASPPAANSASSAKLVVKVSPAPTLQPELEVDAQALKPQGDRIVTPPVESLAVRGIPGRPSQALMTPAEFQGLSTQDLPPLTSPEDVVAPGAAPASSPAVDGSPLSLWIDDLTPAQKAALRLQ